MPRFFMHVRDALGTLRDEEGQELPDLEAARREAFHAAKEYLGAKLAASDEPSEIDMDRVIDVADATGTVLLSVRFSEVVEALENPRAEHGAAAA